jgi:hypothetical protein
MAGTYRFHDKFHRFNHHSVATPGFVESASDPIASKDFPFRGDFVVDGSLSASDECVATYATIHRNLTVVNTSFLSGDIYTDWEKGGVITTVTAGSNTRNGPFSLTLNYNGGVYINGAYGSNAKLIVGTPGALFDQGLISVTNISAKQAELTNIVATNASITALKVKNSVGIGTDNPQHKLHVVGDVNINGTLTASNTLTVTQQGDLPIAAFYDSGIPNSTNVALWVDGNSTRPGWVGIKTNTPNVEFTIKGSTSASGTIYGSNSNSILWENAYNTTNANSARWVASYNTTNANSASWVANYTTTTTNSASWVAVYASVQASSASWNAGGGTVGDTYVVVSSNSARWDSSYSTLQTNSASWVSSTGVSAFESELSASGDFLLVNINGVIRKLRLWD